MTQENSALASKSSVDINPRRRGIRLVTSDETEVAQNKPKPVRGVRALFPLGTPAPVKVVGAPEAAPLPATNPYAEINPDDPRLKRLSGDARMMLKNMADGFFEILRAKPLSHVQALEFVGELPHQTPPSSKSLRTLVAGMVASKLAEQYVNDIFDQVSKSWKTVPKKLLKTHLEVCRHVLDGKSRMVDRGGSVDLNRFWAFSKWFSASVMPPPLRVSAG